MEASQEDPASRALREQVMQYKQAAEDEDPSQVLSKA
jgi:hypothetical protein